MLFRTVLRESLPESRPNRRLFTLPFSIAAHGVALAVMAILSARSASVIVRAAPSIPIVFQVGTEPPAPAGNGAPERRVEAIRPAPALLELRAPAEMPSGLRKEEPKPEESGEAGSPIAGPQDQTGDPSGPNKGGPGGVGRAPVEGGGGSAQPVWPSGDVAPPRLIFRVDPVYPESMRKAHIEGYVLLQATISASGAVKDVHVVKSVSALLDASAVDAVEQWRYRPASLNGRPVSVYLTVTVEFRLR